MFKTIRQIATNLLLIFILEDLIRWGIRFVRRQRSG